MTVAEYGTTDSMAQGVCKLWTGLLEWITGLDYWTDLQKIAFYMFKEV